MKYPLLPLLVHIHLNQLFIDFSHVTFLGMSNSAAQGSVESEVAILSSKTQEVAAAAAEAGAAAVGAAQATAAAAAARGAGGFGRIDDWIVPASDALRLTWVLGTALRVDLIAQLLTVGAKVIYLF